MKTVVMLGLAAFIPLGYVPSASAEEATAKIFTCSVGKKTVSVTSAGGQIVYHYGTTNSDEMSIVGIPKSGNIFQMTQKFAGMEYQLRFKNDEYSYIVYESEGNPRTGAAATSGLVVMRGTQQVSDKSCSRFTELAMPPAALQIPEDTNAYSAM